MGQQQSKRKAKERERIKQEQRAADEPIQAEERERDKRTAKAQKKKSKLKCTVHDGVLSDLEHMLSMKKTEMAELETMISDLAEIFSQQTRELQLATDAKEHELQSREIALMKRLEVLTRVKKAKLPRVDASLKEEGEEIKERHKHMLKLDHDLKNQKAAQASLEKRQDAVQAAEASLQERRDAVQAAEVSPPEAPGCRAGHRGKSPEAARMPLQAAGASLQERQKDVIVQATLKGCSSKPTAGCTGQGVC